MIICLLIILFVLLCFYLNNSMTDNFLTQCEELEKDKLVYSTLLKS